MLTVLEMTATFGKLENQTVSFQEGVNILEAPNEWGKSTWCAFLTAMFYGIDTRSRTTKTALSEKEHFTAWSGVSMAGRMRLQKDGRRMILTRRTAGRVPMGMFEAHYEDTGLPVEGLTGENCGKVLLGVEKEVFLRTCFLRGEDLSVEDHAALQARLHALVTTGEESGGDLQNLLHRQKNRLSGRNGLLSQREAALAAIRAANRERASLEEKILQVERDLRKAEDEEKYLKNHEKALRLGNAKAFARRIAEAQEKEDALRKAWEEKKTAPVKNKLPFLLLPVLAAAVLALFRLPIPAGVCLGAAVILGGVFFWENRKKHREIGKLYAAYEKQKTIREALGSCPAMPEAPAFPDSCDLTPEETAQRISLLPGRIAHLQRLLGQLEGRRTPWEDTEKPEQEILDLREKEKALTLALETLGEARRELQSRFAPSITRRARDLFYNLTEGRYSELRIGQDLSLLAGTGEQTGTYSPLWVSTGTADAMYFCLRLALKEALCPEAPLVLDDVFARFDDRRLMQAMDILEETGKHTQVLLFTCQSREKTIENKRKSAKNA